VEEGKTSPQVHGPRRGVVAVIVEIEKGVKSKADEKSK
jgi:hypothetical protein